MNGLKDLAKLLSVMVMVSIGNDIAITALLNPCGINAGGATGLATVIGNWTGVAFAIVYGVLNVPILCLGVRYLSFRFSLFTVFATVLTTVLFPYLQRFVLYLPPSVATILGAVIYGYSIGVTYRFDFSLGGFALLAKVLEVVTDRKVGTIFTMLNFVPVLLAAITSSSWAEFVWSVVFIVITGETINWTIMGRAYFTHCRVQCGKTLRLPVKVYQSIKHLPHAS